MFTLFFLILSYLIGSINSAVIISKLFNLPSPLEQGSKNPGTTNILRLSGKRFAVFVLIFDILKGFIPVIIAKIFELHNTSLALIALMAVLGHIFPVFFRFKGGKGVATALGAFLGLNSVLGLLVLVTWLIIALISRYSSLASCVAVIIAPFYVLLIGKTAMFVPLVIIAALIIHKHKENIKRLLNKKESKINLKS